MLSTSTIIFIIVMGIILSKAHYDRPQDTKNIKKKEEIKGWPY